MPKKQVEFQSNQSQINLNLNGCININVSEPQSFTDLVDEVRKMGKKFINKSGQLSRFQELLQKMLDAHNHQLQKATFQRKSTNQLSRLDTLQLQNKRSKNQPEIKYTTTKQMRVSEKQKCLNQLQRKSQKRFRLSLRKNQNGEEENLVDNENITKDGAKYQKFAPAFLSKSPRSPNHKL